MPVGSSDFMAEVAACCIMVFIAAANVAIIASTAAFGIAVVDTFAVTEKMTAVNFPIKPTVPDSEEPTIVVQTFSSYFRAFQTTSSSMVIADSS